MTDIPTFVLERHFDAPRPLVWRTWTEADLLARWYGPGVETLVHKLDVRPGGVWLNEMKMGGGSFRERFDYLEVEEPTRLIWLQTSVEEDWQTQSPPRMENWPAVLRGEITLADAATGTDLRLEWRPHAASDVECATFGAAMAGLGRGWGGGMDVIDTVLGELKG